MNTEIEELAKSNPAEWERLQADYEMIAQHWFATRAKNNLSTVQKMLAELSPEDRLAGLKLEDRLAGLKPEDRLAGLKPEEIQALLQKYSG